MDCGACLAVCLRGGVTTGDAYLFDRLGGFSGGVSLDEPLLPASSLTRNTRNTRNHRNTRNTRNARYSEILELEILEIIGPAGYNCTSLSGVIRFSEILGLIVTYHE